MEKLIITSVIAVVVATFTSLFLISFGVKLLSSICSGLIVSDIILFIVFTPDIINGTNSDEIFYIIIYIILCIILYIPWIIYLFVSNTSERCICRCCRKFDYSELH